MDKSEVANTLVILLDLPAEDTRHLKKLPVSVLERMFNGLKENALAWQELKDTK